MTTELLTSAASDTAATAFAKAAAVKNLGERTSRPHCALARDHESRRRGRSPCGDWRPSRRTGLDGRPSAARRLSATLRARPLGGHENRLKRYTKTPASQAARNGVKCCHCCQSQFPVSNWQHWYWQLATFTHWFCKRLCRQSPLFRVARGAGDFVWPEGAFRVRRCGVARQGSRKVQRRRRGEASSREAARLP